MLSAVASALPSAHPAAPLGPESCDSSAASPLSSPPIQQASIEPTAHPVPEQTHGTQTEALDQSAPPPAGHEHREHVGEGTASVRGGDRESEKATLGPQASSPKNSPASRHRLQHAEPRDLPSYPSAGLTQPIAAGAAAASLAHSSAKPLKVWTPNPTSAAGAAASLAHANRKSPEPFLTRDTTGAGSAVSNIDKEGSYELSQSARRSSLTGALEAIQQSNHRRRGSSPGILETNEAPRSGARSAVSSSSGTPVRKASGKRSVRSVSLQQNSPRQSASAESERLKAQDERTVLQAATISMNRQRESVSGSSSRPSSTPPERGPRYPHLEESARRIAQERLARIGHDPATISSRIRSRTVGALTPELEALAASDEMENLDAASKKKRGQDAMLLMTVAKRNVRERMNQQDRQISEKKGVTHREGWDEIATNIAKRDSEARMRSTHSDSQVDIGGGKMVYRDEVDKIAKKNVQPVLNDIEREAAEKRWAKEKLKEKELAQKLEKENQKRVAALRNKQEKEAKLEAKRIRNLEKQQRKKGKEAEKLEQSPVEPGSATHPAQVLMPPETNTGAIQGNHDPQTSTADVLPSVSPSPPQRQSSEPQLRNSNTPTLKSPTSRRFLPPRRSETAPLDAATPESPNTKHGRTSSGSFSALRGHLRRASRTFTPNKDRNRSSSAPTPQMQQPIESTTYVPPFHGPPPNKSTVPQKPSIFNRLRRNLGLSRNSGQQQASEPTSPTDPKPRRRQSEPLFAASTSRSQPLSATSPATDLLPASSAAAERVAPGPAAEEPFPNSETLTSSSEADDVAHGRNPLFTLTSGADKVRRSLSKRSTRSRRKSSVPDPAESGAYHNYEATTGPSPTNSTTRIPRSNDNTVESNASKSERRKSSVGESSSKPKSPKVFNKLRRASFGHIVKDAGKGKEANGGGAEVEMDEERARRLRAIGASTPVGGQKSRFKEDL